MILYECLILLAIANGLKNVFTVYLRIKYLILK
jgi:hypothetical protein